jgi:hypothetical protein
MRTSRLMLAHAVGASMILAATDTAAAAGASTESRQSIVIQGYDFTIPAPYGEGHTLTANEASALNQLYAENVRNNSASRIKAAKEAAEKAGTEFSLDTSMVGEGDDAVTLRASIEEYAANYEFGARRTSTKEPVDPVQREAFRIAKEVVSKQLSDKGIKQKDLADGVYDSHVESVSKLDKVQRLAAKRVKEREGLLGEDFDLGDIATKEAPADGEQAPE